MNIENKGITIWGKKTVKVKSTAFEKLYFNHFFKKMIKKINMRWCS